MNAAIIRLTEKLTGREFISSIFSDYIPVILISLLFIVPLADSSKMFDGVVSAKKYYFYIFMLIIIVYNTTLFIVEKRFNRIALNKIDIAFLLYAGWNLFSAIITNDSYINDKTGELVMLLVYYFIIKAYLTDTGRYGTFINITSAILLTVGIIESIVGLLQVYELMPSNSIYFRITGTFYNPAPYALLLAVIFSFSVAICVFHQHFYKLIKYLSYITCFLILNVIPFTYNRASWIGIAASVLLVLLYYLHKKGLLEKLSHYVKITIFFMIFFMGVAGLILLYNLKEDSSKGRLLIWKVSSNIVKDHPFTGIGYGRFRSEYNLYQADYFKNKHNPTEELLADDVQVAFNDYLETLVETGFIGIGLLAFLIIMVLFTLRNNSETVILYLIPYFIVVIMSLISYPVNSIVTKILFFFYISLAGSNISSFTQNIPKTLVNHKSLLFVTSLCIMLIVIQLIKYHEYKIWLFATKTYDKGSYSVSEEYFQQINKSLKFERFYSVAYAECLMQNKRYSDVIDLLLKARMITPCYDLFILLGNGYKSINAYSASEFSYKEANYMSPGKILPDYLLMKLYYETGKKNKADSIANKISESKIKVRSDSTNKLLKDIKTLYENNK